MQLIDDDIAQVFKEFGPFGMVRQNPGVQHVGIGKDDVGALPDGASRILRGIAIVGKGAQIRAHGFDQPVNVIQLVFRKCLGGEKVKGSRPRFGREPVQHRQAVA